MPVSFVIPVSPSFYLCACISYAPTTWIAIKFDIGDICLRSVKKIQIQLKLAQNIGHCSLWQHNNICGTAGFHRRVQDSVMLPCCLEVSLAVAGPCCATLCQLPLVSLAVAEPCCATLCQLPLVSLAVLDHAVPHCVSCHW